MSWDNTFDNIDQGIDITRQGYDVFMDARDYANRDKSDEDSDIDFDAEAGFNEDAEDKEAKRLLWIAGGLAVGVIGLVLITKYKKNVKRQ